MSKIIDLTGQKFGRLTVLSTYRENGRTYCLCECECGNKKIVQTYNLKCGNFYEWSMNNGYTDSLTIDRIDINGNYCPENCRWVDDFIQANNKSNNHYITYNGETHTIAEWSRLSFFTERQIQKRLKLGWSVEKIFTTPIYNVSAL